MVCIFVTMLEYSYGDFYFLFVFNCIWNVRIGSDSPSQYLIYKKHMLVRMYKTFTDVIQ